MYRGRGNNNNRGGYRNGNGGGGYRNGNSGGRGGSRNSQQTLDLANSYSNSSMVAVQIEGWQNAAPSDLVNFISRKTRIVLQNVQPNTATGILTASVRTTAEAEDLRRASGIRFAGNSLRIQIIDPVGVNSANRNQGTINTLQLLQSFLRTRYNPATKMLDLTNMVHDQTLTQNGLFSTSNTASKFFPALLKVASEAKFDIESVNLSDNNLTDSTHYLSNLAEKYPNLKNLAIGNNNIARTDVFDKVKNKFPHLRELIIANNPVVNNGNQATMTRIMNDFPRLIILNGQQVRNEDRVNALFSFPVGIKSMFFETPDLSKVAANFISTYLTMWDNQRMNLIQLYTEDSQFSYQIDTTHVGGAPLAAGSTWTHYLVHSRNLKRVSGAKARMGKLCTGIQDISRAFQALPKTKHSLQEDPSLYSMETVSFPFLNGMQITLHGQFEETGQPEKPFQERSRSGGGRFNRYNNQPRGSNHLEKRSFDRTFVVVPGPNGDFIVASDLLLLRPLSDSSAWKEHAGPVVAPAAAPVVPNGVPGAVPGTAVPQLPANLNPTQQQLALKIMQETKLNVQFTIMLCEQSNWDYAAASQNFASSRAQIPPQAYQ